MLAEGDISLDEALHKASCTDQAEKDLSQIASAHKPENLFNVSAKKPNTRKIRCYRCNVLGHAIKDCPMPSLICPYCKKSGHSEDRCFRKQNDVKKMFAISSQPAELPYVEAELNGSPVSFLIDTGSSVSVLSHRLIDKLALRDHLLPSGKKTAVSASGNDIDLSHEVECNLAINTSVIIVLM